jgi:hypothetical protein
VNTCAFAWGCICVVLYFGKFTTGVAGGLHIGTVA